MRESLNGSLIAGAFGLLCILAPPAHANEIVTYSFTGNVVAGPATPLLSGSVAANDPISGSFQFDASTLPTTPGNWLLPSAVFNVQFDTLALTTLGATAHVSTNQDLIVFSANVPGSEFPTSITNATLSLGFQTFTDGYFSLLSLPDTVPPNDHMLGLSVTNGTISDGASTDTELFVTASSVFVPEPASLALFGLGLVGVGVMCRRLQDTGPHHPGR